MYIRDVTLLHDEFRAAILAPTHPHTVWASILKNFHRVRIFPAGTKLFLTYGCCTPSRVAYGLYVNATGWDSSTPPRQLQRHRSD